jgi:hypothetical protein
MSEFPDPVMWGLNLEQWKAIAEVQRLNLEQLRAQNNELKSLCDRAAEALEHWHSADEKLKLIAELQEAAK